MITDIDKLRPLTSTEASWFAAAIDFEGSLGLSHQVNIINQGYWVVRFQLVNTNKDIIAYAHGLCQCGSFTYRKTPIDGHKPLWYLQLSTHQLRWLLPQVFPYLVAKHRLVEVLLEALAIIKSYKGIARDSRLWPIFYEAKKLNHKGV